MTGSFFNTCLIGVLLFSESASGQTPRSLTPVDRKFIADAAQGGMLEVELGRVVLQKASAEVKHHAQRMIDDHSKANGELKRIAEANGAPFPDKLEKKRQGDVNRLARLSGAALDKAYVNYMVDDHHEDVAEYEKGIREVKNAELKRYAEKELPALREHLRMFEEAQTKIGATK